jgi:putative inorganic carbon (HCO3(-)) transporter
VKLPRSPVVVVLVLFILWMTVTTAFAIFPGDALDQLTKVFKIQLMTLVALAALHEKRHIQLFVWVNTLSLAFFGAKGGIHTIVTAGGSRVWGPGGFIGGNNEIGLAMLMAIPFLYYLYLQHRQRWLRMVLLVAILLTSIAVLGTQSRGGFLAVIAMATVLWWRAPRKLISGTVIVATMVVAGAILPETFYDRMATIRNYQDDSSAVGRLYSWQTAISIANSRPFGAGFAMYQQGVTDRYGAGSRFEGKIDGKILQARAAHSIYFQVLGEHGWVGLLLFVGLFALTWRIASRLRRQTRGDAELLWVHQLAGLCQVSLVGFGVGGAFLSLAYFDLPYNIMIIVVVTERWLAAHRAARGAAPAVTSHSGPASALSTAARGARS